MQRFACIHLKLGLVYGPIVCSNSLEVQKEYFHQSVHMKAQDFFSRIGDCVFCSNRTVHLENTCTSIGLATFALDWEKERTAEYKVALSSTLILPPVCEKRLNCSTSKVQTFMDEGRIKSVCVQWWQLLTGVLIKQLLVHKSTFMTHDMLSSSCISFAVLLFCH